MLFFIKNVIFMYRTTLYAVLPIALPFLTRYQDYLAQL